MGRHTICVNPTEHYISDITVLGLIITDLRCTVVGMHDGRHADL